MNSLHKRIRPFGYAVGGNDLPNFRERERVSSIRSVTGLTPSGRCVGNDRLDIVELLGDLALGEVHIVTVSSALYRQ